MNIHQARYELTAVKPSQYPQKMLPEIAFVGRSNVGKSSLINTMLNRKNLARVGATPGKTREINFYNIDDILYFVDLPGYGYASRSKTQQAFWGSMVDTYLTSRKDALRLIIMLVDIRHKPSNDDLIMIDWLKNKGIDYAITATKSDKISRSDVSGRLKEIVKTLEIPDGIKPIPFSNESRQGRDSLWGEIQARIPEAALSNLNTLEEKP